MEDEAVKGIEAKLRARGIRDYEIYLLKPKVTELHLRRNDTELINRTEYTGYSVRVLEGGLGIASSTVLSESAVEKTIQAAASAARQSEKTKYSFPTQRKTGQVEIFDKKLFQEPEQQLRLFVRRMLEIAKVQKVKLTFAKIKAYTFSTTIRNSEGLYEQKRETYFSTEVSFKAEDHVASECWTLRYARSPRGIGNGLLSEWAQLAKRGIKAKAPETERTEVIFPPSVVCDLLVPVLSYHAGAESLKQGVSKLKEGEEVAPRSLTVVDDGLFPMGLLSSSFDDEGNPQKSTPIIESGVFKSRLFDQFYALQYGVRPTGNGIREGPFTGMIAEKFSVPPTCQSTNIRVSEGDRTADELIEETEKGVIVYNFAWLSPDRATGNFGAEIRNGALIRNGEITYPLKGGIVSGNVFEMIKHVTGLSRPVEIASGATAFSCVSPCIRFANVQIAG